MCCNDYFFIFFSFVLISIFCTCVHIIIWNVMVLFYLPSWLENNFCFIWWDWFLLSLEIQTRNGIRDWKNNKWLSSLKYFIGLEKHRNNVLISSEKLNLVRTDQTKEKFQIKIISFLITTEQLVEWNQCEVGYWIIHTSKWIIS